MTWAERLYLAAKSGEFTGEDRELATDYTTCAVGEQVVARRLRIKAFSDVLPEDETLMRLGMEFYAHVVAGDVPAALTTYVVIHERGAVLEAQGQ